jgi:PleD family two-component response regulator
VLFGIKILSPVSDFYVAFGEITIKVTVSAGLTYFRKSDRTFIDVIDRVDGALYKSKSSGKNTISFIL